MANQEEPALNHGAFFPPPPPFYKNFTSANLARLKDLQSAAEPSPNTQESGIRTPPPILDLPPELRTLIPPLLPPSGTFKTFGQIHNTAQDTTAFPDPTEPLEPLFPPSITSTSSPPTQLRLLTRSLLLHFLELLGIMSRNPSLWKDKVHHLHVHLVNAHQLINEYRPHQARETLIRLMEVQVARKRGEVDAVREMGGRIQGVLGRLGEEGREVAGEEQEGRREKGEGRRRVQKEMWRVLEEELGVEG